MSHGNIELLTIGEYAQLGETEHGYSELVEGRLLLSPNPAFRHNRAAGRLLMQLARQAPADLEVVNGLDVALEFAAPDEPGTSRWPDLIVVRRELGDRLSAKGGVVRGSEVLAVEVVSPNSRRTDHVYKRADYADAGIPSYWTIDIDEPISLTACRLTEEFGYQDDQTVTGVFATDVPFPVEVSLDRLV